MNASVYMYHKNEKEPQFIAALNKSELHSPDFNQYVAAVTEKFGKQIYVKIDKIEYAVTPQANGWLLYDKH